MLKKLLHRDWKNIIAGWFNYFFPTPAKTEIAEQRLAICRLNICGYHDPLGESEEAVFKGQESCGQCGCPLIKKTLSMGSYCPLRDEGRVPMWEEENLFDMAIEQDEEGNFWGRINYKDDLVVDMTSSVRSLKRKMKKYFQSEYGLKIRINDRL